MSECLSIGRALAQSAFERGERPTDAQREAVTAWALLGASACPARRLGGRWHLDHPALDRSPLFDRKRDAEDYWKNLVEKWSALGALWRSADREAASA